MIILDAGSGNGNGNDINYQKELIDSIIENMGNKDIVIKFQLFREAPPNIPLDWKVFGQAYKYAQKKGIQVTASVFDIDSLKFLQTFEIPFIKIACNSKYYKLAGGINTPLIVSYPSIAEMGKRANITPLCCVPKYPATIAEYEKNFPSHWMTKGISDHTEGFELYHKYQPEVFEKHYVLKHDKSNPDAGVYAMTADDWGEL
jgi:sialic acid synthase SpsE